MSETNETTKRSYDTHVQEYIDGSPQEVTGKVKEWIDASVDGLVGGARIIEFGAAFGRDADYIEQLGHSVERTDATPGFVDYLKDHGHEARVYDAITDDLSDNYDLVLADAVLLHFTRDEAAQVARKVYTALNDGGRFALTLKQGDGEGWSDEKLGVPRYFCYWKKDDIYQLLAEAGFGEIGIGDDSTKQSDAKWLHIIARK